MDHSSHDHHHHMMMDHSSHGDHGDMGGGHMCNMNMLFTWDSTDLCVVFRQWHVTSHLGLAATLVAVVAICAGYEALREAVRRYEATLARRIETAPRQNREQLARRAHIIKAVLYGIQNFYAFMIMLIFMTYNGWVMIAVSVGAGLGYLVFGGKTPLTKETACH